MAQVLEIDLATLVTGLQVQLPQGRGRRFDLPNDLIILDETYNAGLESMLAALEMLRATPGKRHIAVLGTMKELGAYSAQLHLQVGAKAQELSLDLLLILAEDAATEEIAKGAAGIASECFSDCTSLTMRLQEIVSPGDRILCKASNSVGLSQVVAELVKLNEK